VNSTVNSLFKSISFLIITPLIYLQIITTIQ
jgi:hypothetical protein